MLIAVVVDITPFTLDIKVFWKERRLLPVITLLVDTNPFISVVKVLPVIVWLKLFMIFETPLDTPFTMVWNRLADEEATLELMMFALELIPLTLEVRVLVFEVKELDKGIEEVGIVRRVFVRSSEPITTVLPFKVVLADTRDVVFVVEAVIFVAKRFVK